MSREPRTDEQIALSDLFYGVTMKKIQAVAMILAVSVLSGAVSAAESRPWMDTLSFGQTESESGHGLKYDQAEVIQGGLGESARRLLAREPVGEYGGNVRFTMTCDPLKPTYLTVKFWGSDAGEELGRLLLFVEGKQLGVRHLGDIDSLDIPSSAPRFLGRFFYKTLPLPKEMTKGKSSVDLEIRSLGKIWGYGNTWAEFQRPMMGCSRGIYSAFTHTDPFFWFLRENNGKRRPKHRYVKRRGLKFSMRWRLA